MVVAYITESDYIDNGVSFSWRDFAQRGENRVANTAQRPDPVEIESRDAVWREGSWFIKAHWAASDSILVQLYGNSWSPCNTIIVCQLWRPLEWIFGSMQTRTDRAIEVLKRRARHVDRLHKSVRFDSAESTGGPPPKPRPVRVVKGI